MTTDNLVQAALDQGAELLVAESIAPQDEESTYEWTRLIVRLHGTVGGLFGESPEVVACWNMSTRASSSTATSGMSRARPVNHS